MNTFGSLHNIDNTATGVFSMADGSFLAMTRTQSKYFKTRKGAVRWLSLRGYSLA